MLFILLFASLCSFCERTNAASKKLGNTAYDNSISTDTDSHAQVNVNLIKQQQQEEADTNFHDDDLVSSYENPLSHSFFDRKREESGEDDRSVSKNSFSRSRASFESLFSPKEKPIFTNPNSVITTQMYSKLVPTYSLPQACTIIDTPILCVLIIQHAQGRKEISLQTNDVNNATMNVIEYVRSDNGFFNSQPYLLLMESFRDIISSIFDTIESVQTTNDMITNYIKNGVHFSNDEYHPPNQFAGIIDSIQAWKSAYLYLASVHSGVDIHHIKNGCELDTLELHKLSGDIKNHQQFSFSLQFDCINFIFGRCLHYVANQYSKYLKLETYMNAHGLTPVSSNITSISDVELIEYYGDNTYKAFLAQYVRWIVQVFEISDFVDNCWYFEKQEQQYNDIVNINATTLNEWVAYAYKFHAIKMVSDGQIFQRIKRLSNNRSPSTNCAGLNLISRDKNGDIDDVNVDDDLQTKFENDIHDNLEDVQVPSNLLPVKQPSIQPTSIIKHTSTSPTKTRCPGGCVLM